MEPAPRMWTHEDGGAMQPSRESEVGPRPLDRGDFHTSEHV